MERLVETIRGDMPGTEYALAVLRFKGSDPAAPRAYLQAALHGDELPGTVAIDALADHLRKAEAEGRIRGDITLVPLANPIGLGQQLYGHPQGRFHLGTRTNFNRDFPLLDRPDPSLLAGDDAPLGADARLKARLLGLSLGHDIVLDLHCDDEGLPYLYVHAALWPAMADCAAQLGAKAVLLWEGSSDAAFEEAALHPYLQLPADEAALARRVVSTVEYRGRIDVDPHIAEADGTGLYRFLIARGVVAGDLEPVPAFSGPAAPLENVEMVRSPQAGAILYHVAPGDQVEAGQLLATIVHAPGVEGGRTDVPAPQAGLILTRRAWRSTRRGDDLLKLVGRRPSETARPGALED